MKKNIYIVMFFLIISLYLVGCVRVSEDDNEKADTVLPKSKLKNVIEVMDTVSYVKTVERYIDSVNKNLSSLKMTKKDVFGLSAEGAEINVYRHNLDTMKLKAIYYGETGRNEYDLYLRNKRLVFYMEKTTSYKSIIGEKPVRINNVTLTSFVLDGGRIIMGKEDRGIISKKDEYAKKSAGINDMYNEIRLQLKE